MSSNTEAFDLPAPILTDRTCLRCDKMFPSEGKHNRLCRRCRDAAGSDEGVVYPEPMAAEHTGKGKGDKTRGARKYFEGGSVGRRPRAYAPGSIGVIGSRSKDTMPSAATTT